MREFAAAHPHLLVAWIDIEDEDEAMGDIEVDTFPTLLVAEGSEPRFFGPVPPSGPQLARMVARLQARAEPAAQQPAKPEIRALWGRLRPLAARAAL